MSTIVGVLSVVHVRLMEDRTRPASLRRFIRVEVESTRKLATGGILKKQADIFPNECRSEAEFERKIEVLAGTMAAMLDGEYGEGHDPRECERQAREAWKELKAEFEPVRAPLQERGLGYQE